MHSQPPLKQSQPLLKKSSRRLVQYGKTMQALDDFQDIKHNPNTVQLYDSDGEIIANLDVHSFQSQTKISECIKEVVAQTPTVPRRRARLHFDKNVYDVDIESEETKHHFTLTQVDTRCAESTDVICEGILNNENGRVSFSIDGQTVLEEGSPRPRGVQGAVLEKIGEALSQDKQRALLLMGTGSGKSYVIAGMPHALEMSAVYIVPNENLANELKNDALCRLHGKEAPVYLSASLSLKGFQQIVQDDQKYHMILTADDELFHEKANILSGKIVFIDESHQHTFGENSIQTLQSLIESNAVFALTGTPTSRLFSIMGEPLVDINLNQVIEQGGVRTMQSKVVATANKEELVRRSALDYLSNEGYVIRGVGYKSPRDFLDQIKNSNPDLTEKEAISHAISAAISHNREKMSDEKNFIFCGDPLVSEQIVAYYNSLLSDSDVGTKEREYIVMHAGPIRAACEIKERWHMALEIDPVAQRLHASGVGLETVRGEQKAAYKATLAGRSRVIVDLKKDMLNSQIAQINAAINAHALWILHDDGKEAVRDFEFRLRTKTLNDYLTKNTKNLSDNFLELKRENLLVLLQSKITSKLPILQRKLILSMIADRVQAYANALSLSEDSAQNIAHLESVIENENKKLNLPVYSELGAKYIALAPGVSDNPEQKEVLNDAASVLLEQFRFGLVHHVVSSKRFTTGTSIPSVRSCQQVIYSENDPLIEGIETMQLLARGIRDKDGVSLVVQYYPSDCVRKEAFLHVTDIISKESGSKIQEACKVQDDIELKRSASKNRYSMLKRSFSKELEKLQEEIPTVHETVANEATVLGRVNFFEQGANAYKAIPVHSQDVSAGMVAKNHVKDRARMFERHATTNHASGISQSAASDEKKQFKKT